MSEGQTPVLEIAGLSIALPGGGDRAFAVEDVSLSVDAGEIVCVVGESGSGKSVTAFSVMGLLAKALKPVAGAIRLEGEDVLAATPQRLRALRGDRMAMIFQEPMTALNPVLTIGDQIEEVLRIHTSLGPAERRAQVLAMLESMRLPEPERMHASYPHQISGGQRQRVMIAAALILDPALLIADEPTTALDVTTQAQILKLIKDMQSRRGTGVLFITHDFGVVAEIADRVVVMEKGRVVEQGPAADILTRPQHPYTQMLIGAVPSLKPAQRKPVLGPLALETVGLGKTYSSKALFRKERVVHAAKDVAIRVRRGETVGIVGESGSGKTTVARCIARLMPPSVGSILVPDIDIAPLPERRLRSYRRKIQVVFQDPFRSLNPRRTVGASIIEGPMNFGLSEPDALQRARDLMGLVGLQPNALERYPHQFSGGQRQRIAIARALAMEPEILIADEAVSALDVSVQKQVLALLADVQERFNLAILFITHDLRVAAQICDRIVVMEKGVIVEQGATSQVFSAPAHAYTRALIEAAPGRDFATGATAVDAVEA
ncbi:MULTISPECIES: ABC transporter ATP-binding protein [unclassified Bosea (in: a-proteobacteria)]|jgi:peptide/nickel transport system ATP-binding protein|uniref:ABC transporter ATP-binding protein n=1 Tax=unclassified Bosea (in: a-proteobacteria) TaxID=2653178 RepID=UPI00083D0E3C|nr:MULTISPECIES: ABC transporter ATP-binding protein [unclassified Bosea (in: a-proteobacteria)]AOG07320.1 nickel import ATP-binding protein NikE [Bosea sp. RAC05]MBA4333501.1 ABC transporter ATP-binding protein [Methylobacterium sp.]WRH60419.1 MAG: ABC transporter ATP-binding protein [Bosea sp. (in: a-proteobacteria)]